MVDLASGNLLHTLVCDATGAVLHEFGTGLAAVEVEFRTVNDRVRRADAVWFAARRLAEVRAKVREYLEAGVTSVWVISWNRGRGVSAVSDYLSADCLPGVSIPIEAVFPGNIEQA